MQPPLLPVCVWWIASIAVTLLFIAFFVPLMPSRRFKIQVSFAPVMGMAFCVASAIAEHWDAGVLHPLYCSTVLSVILMFVGRREEVRQGALVFETQGEQAEAKASAGFWVQMTLSVTAAGALGLWLSSASW